MSELLHNPKVAILASGGGTTADAYARAIHEGQVNADIGLVVASSPEAGILQKAERWNREYGFDTRTVVINGQTHPGDPKQRGQTPQESEAIALELDREGVNLVALLGYMRIVTGVLVEEYCYLPERHRSLYEARMLNTHPGPLPETADTYGIHTSQRVLDLGLTASRHTVHVVAAGVDTGPTVVAHHVPVEEGDTAERLNQRTQLIEKATIGYAIDKFLRGQAEYFTGLR